MSVGPIEAHVNFTWASEKNVQFLYFCKVYFGSRLTFRKPIQRYTKFNMYRSTLTNIQPKRIFKISKLNIEAYTMLIYFIAVAVLQSVEW